MQNAVFKIIDITHYEQAPSSFKEDEFCESVIELGAARQCLNYFDRSQNDSYEYCCKISRKKLKKKTIISLCV